MIFKTSLPFKCVLLEVKLLDVYNNTKTVSGNNQNWCTDQMAQENDFDRLSRLKFLIKLSRRFDPALSASLHKAM